MLLVATMVEQLSVEMLAFPSKHLPCASAARASQAHRRRMCVTAWVGMRGGGDIWGVESDGGVSLLGIHVGRTQMRKEGSMGWVLFREATVGGARPDSQSSYLRRNIREGPDMHCQHWLSSASPLSLSSDPYLGAPATLLPPNVRRF